MYNDLVPGKAKRYRRTSLNVLLGDCRAKARAAGEVRVVRAYVPYSSFSVRRRRIPDRLPVERTTNVNFVRKQRRRWDRNEMKANNIKQSQHSKTPTRPHVHGVSDGEGGSDKRRKQTMEERRRGVVDIWEVLNVSRHYPHRIQGTG